MKRASGNTRSVAAGCAQASSPVDLDLMNESAQTSAEPRHLSIFVVENHPDTLKYLRMYLEQLGHQVQSAKTLEEALRLAPSMTCDVLISDIGLPDGDGWDLLPQARFPQPVYAIAMSGFGMNADRARSKAAGFRHHLLKPFDPQELEGMLEEAAGELEAGRASPARR